jgi:hypothetical protein
MPSYTAKNLSPPVRRRGFRVAAGRESRYWETVTAAWLNERFGRPVSAPAHALRRAATRRSTPTVR